jgi:hypothetical protein
VQVKDRFKWEKSLHRDENRSLYNQTLLVDYGNEVAPVSSPRVLYNIRSGSRLMLDDFGLIGNEEESKKTRATKLNAEDLCDDRIGMPTICGISSFEKYETNQKNMVFICDYKVLSVWKEFICDFVTTAFPL